MSLLGGRYYAVAQRTQPPCINYYSLRLDPYPPLPFNPFPNLPVYPTGSNTAVYDDRTVDYAALWGLGTSRMSADDTPTFPGFGGGSGGDGGSDPYASGASFNTNDLWIEVTSASVTNFLVSLRLHNTVSNDLYQLQTKTTLNQ
jgi:hypothetical protein